MTLSKKEGRALKSARFSFYIKIYEKYNERGSAHTFSLMNTQLVIKDIVPEDYDPEQKKPDVTETPDQIYGDDQTPDLPLGFEKAA